LPQLPLPALCKMGARVDEMEEAIEEEEIIKICIIER
jgi:hypothetical protein